jgi:hypothetical protein
VERAVDLLVFAPIGVAMFAKDTVPTFLKMFAARGHTEMEQRKQELRDQANQYRTIGQFAVRYGGPEARRQAEATVEGVRRQACATVDGVRRKAEEALAGLAIRPDEAAPADRPAPDRAPADRAAAPASDAAPRRAPAPAAQPTVKPAPASDAAPATNGNGQSAAALPIPGYDQLSASQVVARLEGLGPEELQTIRAYETQHRGRNTILGKIAQLSG